MVYTLIKLDRAVRKLEDLLVVYSLQLAPITIVVLVYLISNTISILYIVYNPN